MTETRSSQARETRSLAVRRRGFLGRFVRNPAGITAVAFLVLVVCACALAGVIAPYGEFDQDLRSVLNLPSSAHWLGTDELGRDVLTRLLYGGLSTLSGVAITVVVASLIGIPLGLYAGYVKGMFDAVGSRVAELLMALPSIVVILLIFAVNPDGVMIAMVAYGVIISPNLFRVARAASMQASEELYVRAAEVSGIGRMRIVFTHALLRAAGPIVVNVAITASIGMLISVGLEFLGLGTREPDPSWGGLIHEAQLAMARQPWLLVPAGAVVGLTVIAFITIGDAVRDSLRSQSGATAAPGSSAVPNDVRSLVGTPEMQSASGLGAGEDGEALLRVEHLSIEANAPHGTALVTDVSFDVREGECVGIVGESGCGKSMTASSILGLLPDGVSVVAGKLQFQGEDLLGIGEKAMSKIRGRRIALVSQDPMVSLDPSYTVGNQIREVLRKHTTLSRAERSRRAEELLEIVKLPEPRRVLKRYPHELSGGMAQRVVIALALAGEPSLLIADEPTASLDVLVQVEIMDLIRSIQRESNLGVVLITHDLGIAAKYCDRVAVLYAGDLVERGPVDQVIHQPLHPYSAGLVACNADLNRSEGFATIDGVVPRPGTWPAGCRFAARCEFVIPECHDPKARIAHLSPDGRPVRCIRVKGADEAVREADEPVREEAGIGNG